MTSSASSFTWRRAVSILVTLLVVAAALWAASRLWDRYELQPWTRDGRVRANVVQIAPDVSGLVTAVPVQDNQEVAAGALLFEVDRARYELALRQAQAQLSAQKVALAQALREADRNSGLGSLVSQEAREQTRSRAEQSRAAVAQAEVAVDSAKLNLARAEIRAPSAGTITNFDLRQGAYASAGHPVLALVDAQSLYVEGYFEETKLARIHVGDAVEILPMGASHPLKGHVESFSAGIADRDRSTSANLLPSVNPSFNWVRLPQRVPVRVKLDPLPAGERLVAGQTVTVQVLSGTASAPPAAPAKAQAVAPTASQPRTTQRG
ncbi:efflux RND transporter periplasmic adaptor subunit [Roseateles chitosanitabidus]|uniref:efflux RND transporter periplasmic adaptor subunit n=1 Tax=Roseateles chitosanitabidus TaxID=65048 RepID=UPI0008317473|nr:HlyD family secretion protein [Roseateles chitosanitabidus]MBO9689895.1 HlyD family secretion protein [Roseateles chitosanitabidus]